MANSWQLRQRTPSKVSKIFNENGSSPAIFFLLFCNQQCYPVLTSIIGAAISLNSNDIFVKADGAELFCKVMGSGEPLIVLHGGAGYMTHDYLLPHMERLAKGNRVLFYDQRGLGKSTCEIIPEHINLKTYIQDIEAIRASLGVKKISLLGHSWGGFLALHYAFMYPESVEKLILLSSMPGTSEDLGLFFPELTKRLAPYQETLQAIEVSELYLAGDPDTVEAQHKIIYTVYLHNPEDIHKLSLWKPQSAVLNGIKVWDIFKEQIFAKPYDLTDRLNALQCPVLIIHGDSDPIPFITAEHLHASIPSSTLVKIDQSGHFPFVEQPESCFQAIETFLKT